VPKLKTVRNGRERDWHWRETLQRRGPATAKPASDGRLNHFLVAVSRQAQSHKFGMDLRLEHNTRAYTKLMMCYVVTYG